MEQYPKISVVTTNFNQDKYLEETIQSVLNQNYPNLEYIIIDGGSTDKSVEIIKKYADKLTYWESAPDKGMYDGLQKGLARTTGEIMAWINSDDMYLPRSFFTVADIFTKFPQITWLLGFPTIWDMESRLVKCQQSLRLWSKFDVLTKNYKWMQQESIFWKRSLWDKVGGSLNTSLKYAGDFDLWLRFFLHEKLYVTTAPLGGFRMRDDQFSMKDIDKYEREMELLIENYPISDYEKKVVKKYQQTVKLCSFLGKFKIFDKNILIYKFKFKYFDYPQHIGFNREEQRFQLYN